MSRSALQFIILTEGNVTLIVKLIKQVIILVMIIDKVMYHFIMKKVDMIIKPSLFLSQIIECSGFTHCVNLLC